MTFSVVDRNGGVNQIELTAEQVNSMCKTGNPVAEINKLMPEADTSIGTPFEQIKAQMGLIVPGQKSNPFGLVAPTIGAILNGSAGFQAGNVATHQSPFGTAARSLVNVAVIDFVLSELQKDRVTDMLVFDKLVAKEVSVASDNFEQPVVTMSTTGGPEQARASRVAQGAEPAQMLFFGTGDKIRRIPAWNIGMSWTDQALQNTTLDYVGMTTAHYLRVERDSRAYDYLSDLWNGNSDAISGAVPSVMSATLDAASVGLTLTHKAWLKFLATNRKFARKSHAICDIDTYLKIESRTGRPGSNNYDPTLARIDPQGRVMNSGFGNDVEVFIVDSAADGGPVPANTIWALDASSAISRVTNTAAAYSAVEQFAMSRKTAMRLDWAEMVYRTFGDTDLKPFASLTLSA